MRSSLDDRPRGRAPGSDRDWAKGADLAGLEAEVSAIILGGGGGAARVGANA